jgi:exosortase D (VPLPA-CTERM-specific)
MSVESLDPPARGVHIWRLSWFVTFLVGCLALLSLWLFWDGLTYMWTAWSEAPEYSHAVLIPPIALFLVWQQKDRLERLPFTGSWWGTALVLLGGGLLLLGQFATIYTVVQYAYLVTLCGMVLAFTGRAAFRWVALPLLILVFMIPLPQFLLINLSTQLQLLSSDLGVAFMRLLGISVYVEGNVIDLGGYKLQVAEACSGLRYLFPLMTLGFLAAYFYRGAPWKRLVVFLSSIPITLVMNSVRVGTIGFMVEHWGIGMAEGFLHEFQGWAVFMVCIGLMLGEIALLHGLGRESGTLRQLFAVEWPAPSPRGAVLQARRLPPPFIGAGLLLLAFVAAALGVPRPVEVTPDRTGLTEFPMHLPGWTGRPDTLEGVYLDTLKLDDYLLADYSSEQGAHLNLYIAYYNSQRKGEAVHSPRSCLPGGGWRLRQFGQRSIPEVLIHGRTLRVNRTLIELGNQRELVYYWFQQRGRVVTNEFAVKWYLFWDALTRHRTDGALVRLITAVPAGANERDADRLLTEFASRIAPTLPRYVPP